LNDSEKITLLRHDLILMPSNYLFWKCGKKILKKGNPNLGITMLFRSRKLVDVINITRRNRGHPLPRNPKDLAHGII
jgi:hypothetical protein